jgi:electron transport complex protein RnfG
MGHVKNPTYRERIGYQAGLLGGFATLAAAMLMIGDLATREVIAERQQDDLMATLTQVVPASLHDNRLLDDVIEIQPMVGAPLTIYRALRERRVVAVAYRVQGQGYAGPIDVLMGVASSGEVLGVRVVAHTETPGLGDKIEIAKHDWIRAFTGRSLADPSLEHWAVRKDGGVFDQLTGATITPRAVVSAVRDGLLFFHQYEGELLAPAVETGA